MKSWKEASRRVAYLKSLEKKQNMMEQKGRETANWIKSVSFHQSSTSARTWILSTWWFESQTWPNSLLPNMDGSWLTHSVYTPKTWSWDWLLRRSSPAAGTLKPSNIFLILAASLGAEASWKKVNCWGPRGPKRSEGIWRHLKGSGDPGEVSHYGC